jgi:hypothetical protein
VSSKNFSMHFDVILHYVLTGITIPSDLVFSSAIFSVYGCMVAKSGSAQWEEGLDGLMAILV